MRGIYPCVEDVGACVCTSRVIVGVGRISTIDIGNTPETPGSGVLGDESLFLKVMNLLIYPAGLKDSILLDILDTRQAADRIQHVVAHLSSEAIKVAEVVDVVRLSVEKVESVVDETGEAVVLHLDDEPPGHR